MKLKDFWRTIKVLSEGDTVPARLFMRGGGFVEGRMIYSNHEGKGTVSMLGLNSTDTGKIDMPKFVVSIDAIDAMEILTGDGKKETHDT